MKKYNSYKDSGIDWLGLIPSNWDIQRLAYNGEFLKGRGVSRADLTEEGVPVVLYGDIYTKYDIKTNSIVRKTSKSVAENSVRIFEGDLLFTASGETKIDIGKCIVFNQNIEAYASGDVVIYRQNKFDSTYLGYLFNSYYLNISKAKLSKGEIVIHIYASQLRNIHFGCPSISEQTQIANYLDHKTTEIDSLIDNKEKLIALLQEERTAVINQAVTKGLDSNVPMKDSGIEWLGEIPEHWEVNRMKYLCGIGTGDKDTENKEDDGEYPFFVRSQTIERISSYSFDGEAILTAGDGVGVCKVWHYINGKFDYHQRVYRMSHFNNVSGKYLFYYLKYNFIKEVKKLSAKSTVDSLRRPMFQNFRVAFSSIEEQKEIVAYIEKNTNRISDLVNKYNKEIELLKEYKTALISEVVTGKVDVRNEKLN